MLVESKVKKNNSVWYLESQHGKSVYSIPIDKDPFIVGRSQNCNLILPAKEVSRNHAKIYRKGDSLYIKDLDSTNGTLLNQKQINEERALNDGDLIVFGSMKFKFCRKEEENDEHTATYFSNKPLKQNDFFEYYDITSREKEIFYLIIEGKSTKEIADAVFISPGTAKNHVLSIFKKMDVHSRMMLMTKYLNFKNQS